MAVPSLEVRVLGPVSVVIDGIATPLTGRAHRALLGTLVLSIGHPVPVDVLIDAVWGDTPPHDARSAFHSLVSRLRHELPIDVIEHVEGSYLLDLTPDQVDACRFESELAAAEEALHHDPAASLSHAKAALGLWNGDPYVELENFEPGMLELRRLEELRARAMELAWEANIELGHHERVVGSLEAAVAADPYREHLWYLLMVALARSGRRVEAIRAYDDLCRTLGNLGLEPTADLKDLPNKIVSDDPELRPHFEPSP